jgi:hypothetical protein
VINSAGFYLWASNDKIDNYIVPKSNDRHHEDPVLSRIKIIDFSYTSHNFISDMLFKKMGS